MERSGSTQNIRIRRKSQRKRVDLKSRLYDQGINVRRPVSDLNKPYNAVMKGTASQPRLGYNKQLNYQQSYTDFGATGGPSNYGAGLSQMSQHETIQPAGGMPPLKPAQSEADLRTLQISARKETNRSNAKQLLRSFREQSMRQSMQSQGSNPQFSRLNMAPYMRPVTSHFGYKAENITKDPTKKAAWTSEEVSSITGVKTMTALAPGKERFRKGRQDLIMNKRTNANRTFRKKISGPTQSDQARSSFIKRMKQEQMDSPVKSMHAGDIGGDDQNHLNTEELLRSHYLMSKITGRLTKQGQRPYTTDFFNKRSGSTNIPGSLNAHGMQSSRLGQFMPPKTAGLQQSHESPLKSMGGRGTNYEITGPVERLQDKIDENPRAEMDDIEGSERATSHVEDDEEMAMSQADSREQEEEDPLENAALKEKWSKMDQVITLLQNQPDDTGQFFYLNPKERLKTEKPDPYNLQPLIEGETQEKLDSKKTFYTLSKKGITTYVNNNPVEYISLTDWLIERNFYQQISQKKFFKQFRKWKIIRMWRRNIMHKKREDATNNLRKKLFMLDEVFGPILREHKNMITEMEKLRFVNLSNQQMVYTLDNFSSIQNKQRADIQEKIQDCSAKCRIRFKDGIQSVLGVLRKNINEQNENEESHKKDYKGPNQQQFQEGGGGAKQTNDKKPTPSDPIFEQLGFKHSLSYGPRANLRRECTKFLRFSYLLDFVTLEGLSNIYLNSVRELIKKLSVLNDRKIFYEFRSSKGGQFGGENRRPIAIQGNEPLFELSGEFVEKEVPEDQLVEVKVPNYDPAPGQEFDNDKGFDPLVHVELEKPEDEDAEEEEYVEGEEDVEEFHLRLTVPNLPPIWLQLSPSKSQFISLLNECFTEGMDSLRTFERWSRHEELLPYVNVLESWDDKVCEHWETPDDNYLNCHSWLDQEDDYKDQTKIVNNLISEAFEKTDRYMQNFQPFLLQYWENKLIDYDLILHEELKNPQQTLPLLLSRFERQIDEFDDLLPEEEDLGLLRVKFGNIKSMIKPNPKDCFGHVKKSLPPVIKERIRNARDWLDSQIQSITGNVSGVDEYCEQLKALKFIDNTLTSKCDEIDTYQNIHTIFHTHEIDVPKDDANLLSQVYQLITSLRQAHMTATENSDRLKEEIKKTIRQEIPQFKKQVEELRQSLLQDKFLKYEDDRAKREVILTEIKELEKQEQTLNAKSKQIQDWQRDLEMDMELFKEVEETETDMKYRAALWRSIDEWQDLIKGWINQSFKSIETDQISAKSEHYTKIVVRCGKVLPYGSSAVEYLQKKVFDFKETMPIVTALGNDKLGEDHWQQIKDELEVDIDMQDDAFTLGDLMDLNAVSHQEELQLISTTASQEYNLNQQLQGINFVWNDQQEQVQFDIKIHKETYFILGELEDVQDALDQSLTDINNIIGSRYVKKLKSQADFWQKQLLTLSEVLDQWKEFQGNWIYLENIFESHDVRSNNSNDYNQFQTQVNKFWEQHMKKVNTNRKVIAYSQQKLLIQFQQHNQTMDKIQKNLDKYLEQKRSEFPRFYFLSNDELLQVLSCASDLQKLEKHLSKFFENIYRLVWKEDTGYSYAHGMISAEGEVINFKSGKKTTGDIQEKMKLIQEGMRETLEREMKALHVELESGEKPRKQWVLENPGQIVATISQVQWTEACEMNFTFIEEGASSMQDLYDENVQMLMTMTELVRGDLDPVKRRILVAVITTDVHNRDIVNQLNLNDVTDKNDFTWQQQLRYYMGEQIVTVKQVNAELEYGYEYLGATTRLVITPLTDRCWITITGALQIKLGAAPAGPAGTGKTESTKDLAKGLGIQCVVFNCSDQIDFQMMARLFSGLVQQGAWTCLDEFNRIEIEVLSVIAQQLLTIRFALLANAETFTFNGKDDMPINPSCGVFITMNPGYAGRTELPDNLKVLFRPVSMMIPSYGLIAEIMLFAEGFSNAQPLSVKMVQLYKLASEQLSQQDHYDFGMRAVKSVLVMAGTLKRANPQLDEDVVLIRAMRDSNVPKFLADDLPLFSALIQDLFPGVEIPAVNYGELQVQIEESIVELGFQRINEFILKVIQLFDTFNVRFGVMIVGPTGAGKSSIYQVLKHAMTSLKTIKNSSDTRFNRVEYEVLNPKSITMGELYGEENSITKEWTDGLASGIMREAAKDDTGTNNWTVFDGPVDAIWIENMNTVLDDNMTLCLANGERIKLKPAMRMLFEVQDLRVASPATVSRCGMVYATPSDLGWKPYVESWFLRFIHNPETRCLSDEAIALLKEMFNMFCDISFAKLRELTDYEPMPCVEIQTITNLCNFLEYFLTAANGKFQVKDTLEKIQKRLEAFFAFSFIWSFGGSHNVHAYKYLDNLFRDCFAKCSIPLNDTVFEYFIDFSTNKFIPWSGAVPNFSYEQGVPYFSILVPTIDTCRYSYLLDVLLQVKKHVFFTGETGVGKSVVIQKYLADFKEKRKIYPNFINFSAQTNSYESQQNIEEKMMKVKNGVYGAPNNQNYLLFIDDINMPQVEEFGAQPPIELLRQLIDQQGFYQRPKFQFIHVKDFVVVNAAAPPSGGRSPLTPRFMRHFHIFCMPDPNEETLAKIFESIINGYFKTSGFPEKVCHQCNTAVQSTIELYNSIQEGLLPTPAKFHYTFNLRDISKIFQGILMCKPLQVPDEATFSRLWLHESSRVFADRLINKEDRAFFREKTSELLKNRLRVKQEMKELFETNIPIFSNLLKLETEGQAYEEVESKDKLIDQLVNMLYEYNIASPTKMDLVFFMDAVFHTCRISRVLLQKRGNAMLIGVSGCGKQSLTKLSSFMLEYEFFQIQLNKNYKPIDFRQDLKKRMLYCGIDGVQKTFIMTDTQIVNETFLEDINNILNTGEITKLYDEEDEQRIQDEVAKVCKQMGRPEAKDVIYATYVERVRDNFHIILCMSPVGDQLRVRCRQFPSLVNCCTLDWYDAWTQDALLNVATKFINDIEYLNKEEKENISYMFCSVHLSVQEMSERYYDELRRRVYITPKSYLDGISLYRKALDDKRNKFFISINRLSEGLDKLKATKEQVAQLQQELTELEPTLKQETEGAREAQIKIEEETQFAAEKEKVVQKEAGEMEKKNIEISEIKDQVEAELQQAMPALLAAQEALSVIQPADISEIKQFLRPAPAIVMTMSAVLIYLKMDYNQKNLWDVAKKALGDMKFLNNLKNYPVDTLQESLLKKVRKIIEKKDFKVDDIYKVSQPAGNIAKWCVAVEGFAVVNKKVKPIKESLAEMTRQYDEATADLNEKQAALKKIQDRVGQLRADLKSTEDKIAHLEFTINNNTLKLGRAKQLIELLYDEGIRWGRDVKIQSEEVNKLVGDVFIAAASIGYIGPFTGVYRDQLTDKWVQELHERDVPSNDDFSLRRTLGDPILIREWNNNGLPSDPVSTANGIFCENTTRWPLSIDPQTQANRWIKRTYGEELKVIKLTETDTYPKVLDSALRLGHIVLIEDIQEELDPALDNILQKAVFKNEGVEYINFQDKNVPYERDFKLFITTKMPNPHYLPEICIKLTIINFTVTFEGLEEQMLVDVVIEEQPETQRKAEELIINLARCNTEKEKLEIDILDRLAKSDQETLLDTDDLIIVLKKSKEKSAEIAIELESAEGIQKAVNETRNQYRSISIRGSLLYFVITDLALIDPMYQYSLGYVKTLFVKAIRESKQSKELEARLQYLLDNITKTLYDNVCRGLFEAHKLIYSFLICTQIKRQAKEISMMEWNLLLRGAGVFDNSEQPDNPIPELMNEFQWNLLYVVTMQYEQMKDIRMSMVNFKDKWTEFAGDDDVINKEFPDGYNEHVTPFLKMILIKVLCPEKLLFAINEYVVVQQGQYYAESPPAGMQRLYDDSDEKHPVIFVLSAGADPTGQLTNFAEQKGFKDKLKYTSLGQGQERIATNLIEHGKKDGSWVLLQNCHLFKSWMNDMEEIVMKFQDETDIHPDFRLFLTSMPAKYFPVSVLQEGLKMTTEPPKGMKANIKRSYNELMDDESFKDAPKFNEWNRLLFGLCFFHSVVQERRKFGPLGWNILYEFNDSDLETSIKMLKMFLEAQETPWDALRYMTGQINYGGRVTDDWDRTLLLNILKKYYSTDVLEDGYKFSESGKYYAPNYQNLQQYKDFIDKLPLMENPEVFGMHQNASITYQAQESEKIMSTILDIQPRISGGGGGKSSDEIILEMVTEFKESAPQPIDTNVHQKELFKKDKSGLIHCLATVLQQEVERFNKLLKKIHLSLDQLEKAIQGLVLMSQELDDMYSSFLKNRVPPNWEDVSYLSLKPLSAWSKDLIERVAFMQEWMMKGHPKCYWMSGFFFPHGFMTGTLQTYARKHMTPIDALKYTFKVLPIVEPSEVTEGPEDGIYINGLFMEAAKWNFDHDILEDQSPGETFSAMPIIHFLPNENYQQDASDYSCPVYKTSERRGILNTTGQSTNFILAVDLPTVEAPEHWTLRGAALLTMLNE